MLMFTDSANARHKALNPLQTARTKHIDLRYKWIIDRIKNGFCTLQHVPSEEMVADGLTKPLEKVKHQRFCVQVGLQNCPF